MENKSNLRLLTVQEQLAHLQILKEQLERNLAATQNEVHLATLGVLESDENQPLDKQAEKIVEFTMYHGADAPWFYATLNSIIRASMDRSPILSEVLKSDDIELPDDKWELGKDQNLKLALAYAYYGVFPEFPSAVSKAEEYLKSGAQKREESEKIYGFHSHPRRASTVFQWLGENINTLAYFSQLPWIERKKYLANE